jgi:hypothetical protein
MFSEIKKKNPSLKVLYLSGKSGGKNRAISYAQYTKYVYTIDKSYVTMIFLIE